MNTADTTPTTPDQAEPIDWSRFNAMSAEARHRAALDDPDTQPLTEADFARMKRTPQAKLIRRALDLTQEEFAARYHIHSVRCATGNKAAPNRIKPPALT